MWQVRRAFFCDARNLDDQQILQSVATQAGIPVDRVQDEMHSGRAMAAMFRDVEVGNAYRAEGSPTYVLNEGRQKLYGNIGYKILEANVYEVLNRPEGQASWY